MSEYRRLYRQQGWYFFTVVTYNREKIHIQPDNLKRLRLSFHHVMTKYPLLWMLWSFYPIIFTASGAYILTMTIFQRAVEANQAVFLHWYECPINRKGRKEGMAKKVLGTPVEK